MRNTTRFKYIFSLMLFVFASFLMQQCDDGCGDKERISMRVASYQFQDVVLLNTDQYFQALHPDSLPAGPADSIAFRFMPLITGMAGRQKHGDLYACDPVFPDIHALGDSLRVLTLYDFDADHKAGSDVSELFGLCVFSYDGPGVMILPLNRFAESNTSGNSLMLGLLQKPAEGNQRFRVQVFRKDRPDTAVFETAQLRFR